MKRLRKKSSDKKYGKEQSRLLREGIETIKTGSIIIGITKKDPRYGITTHNALMEVLKIKNPDRVLSPSILVNVIAHKESGKTGMHWVGKHHFRPATIKEIDEALKRWRLIDIPANKFVREKWVLSKKKRKALRGFDTISF